MLKKQGKGTALFLNQSDKEILKSVELRNAFWSKTLLFI